MVQLESISDPMWFKNITLSKDPIPYFRSLQEKYSSGILKVPSVGAGTANTEFEVLTGISVRSFGPGEYPYKSILLKTTVETVAYDLKGIGYSAHAIHNHRGAFYGRNLVYPNMGFDTFTSLEYMNNVVKTPRNWARDSVLTEYIMDAMKKTEKEDFVFTVSVEGHGAYPNIQVLQEPYVEVTDAPSEELKWQYEYYVNLLNSMDNFIKELTSALSQYNEKVILVLYGDHLPAIDFTEEDLLSGDMYETPYVIWSNYYLPKEEKTLYAYQLAAETFITANIP
ncbi:MAG: LTA synthase family protein [Clostridiales bacterium]|nr:LTA synthase family protein [Clostridiales bacterium]